MAQGGWAQDTVFSWYLVLCLCTSTEKLRWLREVRRCGSLCITVLFILFRVKALRSSSLLNTVHMSFLGDLMLGVSDSQLGNNLCELVLCHVVSRFLSIHMIVPCLQSFLTEYVLIISTFIWFSVGKSSFYTITTTMIFFNVYSSWPLISPLCLIRSSYPCAFCIWPCMKTWATLIRSNYTDSPWPYQCPHSHLLCNSLRVKQSII